MTSANALVLGDARLKLARPICRVFEHFAKRGFEFFLLPNRVHAHASAMLRERTPLSTLWNIKWEINWYFIWKRGKSHEQ
jgi:hypothetical protein